MADQPSPSAAGGAEGPPEKAVNRTVGVSPVPDTTPDELDEAAWAAWRSQFADSLIGDLTWQQLAEHEQAKWRRVVAAAHPYLVAAALREAAGALDETGEKLHTYAAMDWAAAWLRERAAGLFPGTGTPPRHHRAPVGETDTTPPDRDPYDSAKGGVSDADEWAAGAARETTPGGTPADQDLQDAPALRDRDGTLWVRSEPSSSGLVGWYRDGVGIAKPWSVVSRYAPLQIEDAPATPGGTP